MGKLIDAVQQKNNQFSSEEFQQIKDQLLRGDTKRLNCDVPVELYKKLQIKVIHEDESITSVINRLVYEYIKN